MNGLTRKCTHAACHRDHYDHPKRSVRRYDRLIRNLANDASAEARRVEATCVWGVDATPLRSRYGLLTFRASIGAECLQWVGSGRAQPSSGTNLATVFADRLML
jgi:hypothetical protein